MNIKVENTLFNAILYLVLVSFLMTVTGVGVKPLMAQAANNCEEELEKANQNYTIGHFDEAIQIITNCLNKPNLSMDEKKKAYRLLGLTYIAKDYLEDAKTAVTKLLDLVPNYKSDPIQDPPPFTQLVEEVKKNEEDKKQEEPTEDLTKLVPAQKKSHTKTYLLIGGSVVAAGVAVALLAGGGSSSGNNSGETAAGFPAPPARP